MMVALSMMDGEVVVDAPNDEWWWCHSCNHECISVESPEDDQWCSTCGHAYFDHTR